MCQGEKPFHQKKGSPPPSGTFAKLEGLRKNENVEKGKRQTEVLETVFIICTTVIEGLLRISSQHSSPSQLCTNFDTSEKLFISSE